MYKFLRLINTVKYLKFTQIVYQIFYRIGSEIRRRNGFHYLLTIPSKSFDLELEQSITSDHSNSEYCFTFLNLTYNFVENIDWNYPKFGKLWTYNLTYFDYLQQKAMDKDAGEELIYSFIDHMDVIKEGLEPYPLSLRVVNWIKFLTQHKIKDQKIDDSLLAQYYILMDNLEFHLLGNHLLENAFSLLFGAYYFQDEKLYMRAKNLIIKELKEQILDDGAHFELSPMYHQLILFRVLDCINLVKNNPYKKQELLSLLEDKARSMLNWINTMTFKNGNIPLFNDSSKHIAPTTTRLNDYAKKLKFNHQPPTTNYQLSSSGYRKYVQPSYELIVDVGNIGPDYIPGHAHADTFNFELYVDKKPFIVDTGISTYEKNKVRHLERSTESHNTVKIFGTNQSQVWGGFRVGKRAQIISLVETKDQIIASHDGYKKLGVVHQRSFISRKKGIEIRDRLIGKKVGGKTYFHLHPSIRNIVIEKDQVNFPDLNRQIKFYGDNMKIEKGIFEYALGFNRIKKSTLLRVSFKNELITKIARSPSWERKTASTI